MTTAPASPLSNYLHHLSIVAREERDRFRGVPPFTVLLGLAAFTHIALITPVLFARVAEAVPHTQQVRLAFGLEKEAKNGMLKESDAQSAQTKDDSHSTSVAPASFTPPATPKDTLKRNVRPSPKASAPKQADQVINPVSPRRNYSPVMARPTPARTLRSLRGSSGESGEGYGGDIVGSPEGVIVSKYEQLLSGWINSHRLNQILTLPAGTQGRVVVRLRINRRGYVIFKTIEQSSGLAALDKAAIDVVSRASPVPAVPQEYPGGGQLEFLIPINFVVN
jgi:TonB family protein